MKTLITAIVVVLVAGFWLMPVPPGFAQSEHAKLEREIEGLRLDTMACETRLGQIQAGFGWGLGGSAPPLRKSTAEIEKEIERLKQCIAAGRRKLKELREKLEKLPPRPNIRTPEDPKSPPPPTDEEKRKKLLGEPIDVLEKRLVELDKGTKRAMEELEERMRAEEASQAGFNVETKSGDGLSTTTFTTPQGRLQLYLPSDRRPGDTISGTVVAEPNGQTPEERAKNLEGLNRYQLKIANETLSGPWGPFTWEWLKKIPKPTPTPREVSPSDFRTTEYEMTGDDVQLEVELITPVAMEKGVRFAIRDGGRQKIEPPPSDPVKNQIKIPAVGQNGRSAEITGRFDGKRSTTKVKIGGQPATILAESLGSCIVKIPEHSSGPTEIAVNENGVEARGNCHILSVEVTADKLNLRSGEQSNVLIKVKAGKGIQQNIPLRVETTGAVNMEGGNVQNIQLRPTDFVGTGVEVTANVRKVVIGLHPGVFNLTATVIDPLARPIIIPLAENGSVNGYEVKKEGTGFVVNIKNVKHPITGDPVEGKQKLEIQCPSLSKLPLLKNILLNKGYGTTSSACQFMVKPSIIISEEN